MGKGVVISHLVFGAICGAVAWYVTDRRWRDRNERDVAEVRENLKAYYKEREVEKTERIAEETRQACEEEFRAAQRVSSTMPAPKEKPPERDIFIIKPEEYGDNPSWAKFSYVYDPDTDSYTNATFDIEVDDEEILDMIGTGIPDHFGEFEDDAVYVRNQDLKTDIAVYLKEAR